MGQTWINVLSKPVENLKAEVQNKNGLTEGAVAYTIAALVAAALTLVTSLVSGLLSIASSGPLAALGILLAPAVFLIVLLGSFIGAGIIHLGAKIMGGKGSYSKFYYLMSTFAAPIIIANALLGFVPCLGSVASLVLGIYEIYLTIVALRELHGFDTAKAFIAWLLPILVVGALMVVVLIAAMGSIAMLGFFPGASYDAKVSGSDAYWMNTRPFQIRESAQSAGSSSLTLVLQNVESDQLTLTRIDVSGDASGTYSIPTYLSSGDKQVVRVQLSRACTAGEIYTYMVNFAYTDGTPGGVERHQYGAKPVLGKCA
ncbi:Yip1 domain protein [uncultured archaeon]|nr:Yip1 domain protein [uncultured archaeon]